VIRHQHRRGVKDPPGIIYVGRPSRWGNPFRIWGQSGAGAHAYTRHEAVSLYAIWLDQETQRRWILGEDFLRPLRGAKGLSCYCRPEDECHADVLRARAEAGALPL
jgi:hypothetical protein